jgi:hypothetical protein
MSERSRRLSNDMNNEKVNTLSIIAVIDNEKDNQMEYADQKTLTDLIVVKYFEYQKK